MTASSGAATVRAERPDRHSRGPIPVVSQSLFVLVRRLRCDLTGRQYPRGALEAPNPRVMKCDSPNFYI
jgi:hypothetical protein